MFRKMLVPLLAVGLVGIVTAQQEVVTIDTLMNSRIREEGMKNSQIMKTMHYLTDVHGPRLTGSPNHENAAKWAVAGRWSGGAFTNGKLEPWDFSRVGNEKTVREGWLNEKASGHILSPVKDNLVFEVLAWTPSTKGTVSGPAVHIVAPQGPLVENAGGGAARPRRSNSVSAQPPTR